MVTVSDLEKDRHDRERAEQERTKQREQERLVQQELDLKRDLHIAETVVDGKLGEYLLDLNRRQQRTVKLTNKNFIKSQRLRQRESSGFVCGYHPSDLEDYWTEDHSSLFRLSFTPRENYEPTQKLKESLIRAGFGVTLGADEERNYSYRDLADGNYDIVYEPGTHFVYYLIITW